jgi:Arc/MetJ-type ribon-helix-helix transcriptional regulator
MNRQTNQEVCSVQYEIPSEIKTMIADRMATGKYATEVEVLRRALRTLAEYDEAVTDIQEGMDDEAAGRIRPLDAVDVEIRRKLGFTA